MSETYSVQDPFTGKQEQISDRLIDRLRGRYACGPMTANGEPEFGWREFGEVAPIQKEAATEIERLQAIERAAYTYFMGYAQDEADDAENCLDDAQHEAAKALGVALGIDC